MILFFSLFVLNKSDKTEADTETEVRSYNNYSNESLIFVV